MCLSFEQLTARCEAAESEAEAQRARAQELADRLAAAEKQLEAALASGKGHSGRRLRRERTSRRSPLGGLPSGCQLANTPRLTSKGRLLLICLLQSLGSLFFQEPGWQ